MTLLEHLAELRNVVVAALLAVVVATAAGWFFSERLLEIVVAPMRDAGQRVYFHAPAEAFMVRLKVAFFAGLLAVLPYVIARLYGFVIPGLYQRERRVATPLIASSVLLFYGGVAFCFLLLVPQIVRIMLGFGTEQLQPLIGVGPYIGFVAQLCLAFGLVFELPLVVLLLSWAGLVQPRALLRAWRLAVIVIVIMSAVLTPGPDVVSQLVMAIPVTFLYLSSAVVALVVNKRRAARAREED
jgi:sec-independent protein translocase protein TatC